MREILFKKGENYEKIKNTNYTFNGINIIWL